MSDHFLAHVKAYAAILGAVVATVLTVVPADSEVHAVLVVVGVLTAGVITALAPANKPKA